MIENPYMILFVLKNIVHAINEKYLSDITCKCILYQNRYILYFIGFKGLIKRPTLEYPYSPHAVNRTLLLVYGSYQLTVFDISRRWRNELSSDIYMYS